MYLHLRMGQESVRQTGPDGNQTDKPPGNKNIDTGFIGAVMLSQRLCVYSRRRNDYRTYSALGWHRL